MGSKQDKLDRVCEYRGLPKIKIGQPCVVNGDKGLIVGGNGSCNLSVRLAKNNHISNCHPLWKMVIKSMDLKEVIFDSEEEK